MNKARILTDAKGYLLLEIIEIIIIHSKRWGNLLCTEALMHGENGFFQHTKIILRQSVADV